MWRACLAAGVAPTSNVIGKTFLLWVASPGKGDLTNLPKGDGLTNRQ